MEGDFSDFITIMFELLLYNFYKHIECAEEVVHAMHSSVRRISDNYFD